ncbi:MAG: hypothetical protein PGN16_07465 [Sphingomonas phyllosphaerae]|uniref:hypothetical protein n=1 Tax=Sphingomonas phyllosphaerae TaxID=257003 RepID=UPI002FF9044E
MLGALATMPLTGSSDAAARTSAGQSNTPSAGVTVTPEQFGAVGDGVVDDAPALQRAMDALAARPQGGTLLLQARTAYRCNSGLSLDTSYVSLTGTALLDFSGWQGRYLRVTASSLGVPGRQPDNNYGRKGMISGAIRIKGAGQDTSSIGVDFDSPNIATSAQMLVENLSVFGCGIGVRFGSHAYNNLFLRCEVFNCGICVDYPTADDNGERNTLIGCTLYNSRVAVRMANSSASLQLQGCSLDYTTILYDVTAGSVLATSCHHESGRWEDGPIRCTGDGSFVRLDGGWLLNQAKTWGANTLADVGQGASVHLLDMLVHNFPSATRDPSRPPCWARGPGALLVRGTQGFDFGDLPNRLQEGRTLLSDPDFHAAEWQDTIWRTDDTLLPIVDRYAQTGANLKLAKGRVAGERGLIAAKAYGTTSAAAFVLIALPVRDGDTVLSGFRVRRDPARPGADGTLFASPGWARIDGQDAYRMPVTVRLETVGTLTVKVPTDRFVLVSPTSSRTQRTAPPWATHFCMLVNLAQAHQASFLFNGLWADVI